MRKSGLKRTACAAVALCAIGLMGCAPKTATPEVGGAVVEAERKAQLEIVGKRKVNRLERLHRVAMTIDLANADICGEEVEPSIGATFYSPVTLSESSERTGALAALGVAPDETASALYVLGVAPGGPAALAGLKRGDPVLGVNGASVPAAMTREESVDVAKAMKPGAGANTVKVSRGGETVPVTVQARNACAYPVALLEDAAVNAYADGKNIFITRGMMDFVKDDEELAIVYGHELAHNTEGHNDSKQTNAMIGMAGGLVVDVLLAAAGVGTGGAFMRAGGNIGSVSYSQAFEKEADYVGLYYVAKAGYETDEASDFWRRMATENESRAITAAGTHPTTAERFVLLDATHDEIIVKQGSGLALSPQYKDTPVPATATTAEGES